MADSLKGTLPVPGKGVPLYQAGPYTIYRGKPPVEVAGQTLDTRTYWIEGELGGNRVPVRICWDEEDALFWAKAWGAEPIAFPPPSRRSAGSP